MRKKSIICAVLLGAATLPQQLFSESLPGGGSHSAVRTAVREAGGTGGGSHPMATHVAITHPVAAVRAVDIKADEAKAAVNTLKQVHAEKSSYPSVTRSPDGKNSIIIPRLSTVSINGSKTPRQVATLLAAGKIVQFKASQGSDNLGVTEHPFLYGLCVVAHGGESSSTSLAVYGANGKTSMQSILAPFVSVSGSQQNRMVSTLQKGGTCTAPLRAGGKATFSAVQLSGAGAGKQTGLLMAIPDGKADRAAATQNKNGATAGYGSNETGHNVFKLAAAIIKSIGNIHSPSRGI